MAWHSTTCNECGKLIGSKTEQGLRDRVGNHWREEHTDQFHARPSPENSGIGYFKTHTLPKNFGMRKQGVKYTENLQTGEWKYRGEY